VTVRATSLLNCDAMKIAISSAASSSRPKTGTSSMSKTA
jgi:hypothetical protein